MSHNKMTCFKFNRNRFFNKRDEPNTKKKKVVRINK